MKKCLIALVVVLMLGLSVTGFAGEEKEKEKVTINAYGKIKLDAVYETGRASHGNFAIWAAHEGDNDGNFHITARETRLGMAIKGFGFGKFKVTGKVEVDFYSSGTPENKAYNYMRHAYMQISDGSLSFIAGQYWDIISPLNASTLNYPVMWGCGNIGYRRPQISVHKVFKTGKNAFTIQAGVFRTIASDFDQDGIEDGVAAGFPTLQGRIAGKFGIGENASFQLGLSGHYGKSKGLVDYTSDSLNVDMHLVLSPKFQVRAEYFTGKNLGAFLGGIVQTVNGSTLEEIKAQGFFVNAIVGLSKKAHLSLGYGMDDPDDDTLSLLARSKNAAFFGNIVFKLSRSVQIGFEVSHWATDYYMGEQQKTTRLQNSWILVF